MKSYLLSNEHETYFNAYCKEAQVSTNDYSRLALFLILTGNEELRQKIHRIYDFSCHRLKSQALGYSIPLSSSAQSLLSLGLYLYNQHTKRKIPPFEVFWHLDPDNTRLALTAIQLRFLHN